MRILKYLLVLAITLSAISVTSAQVSTIKHEGRQLFTNVQHAYSHVITVNEVYVLNSIDPVCWKAPSIMKNESKQIVFIAKTINVSSPYLSVKLPDRRINNNSNYQYNTSCRLWTYYLPVNYYSNRLNKRQSITFTSINRNTCRYNLSHDYGLSC